MSPESFAAAFYPRRFWDGKIFNCLVVLGTPLKYGSSKAQYDPRESIMLVATQLGWAKRTWAETGYQESSRPLLAGALEAAGFTVRAA